MHCSRGRLLRRGLEFHVRTINKSAQTKSLETYLIILVYIHIYTSSLAEWIQCSPMAPQTRIQSQVKSYQRLKKWYLIPPCLTLSIIRCVSRVKWRNQGKGVTLGFEKEGFRSPSTTVVNFIYIYIYIRISEECVNVWIKCYKIAEGFRFMPLSLVRLRNFRLSTWVS